MGEITVVQSILSMSSATEAEWLTVPYPIPDGMIIHVTDKDILKKGNGIQTYTDLPIFLDLDIDDHEVGQMIQWPRSLKFTNPPRRALYCDGSTLNRYTYSELFAVIGYNHGGSGDSFQIPKANDISKRSISHFIKYI